MRESSSRNTRFKKILYAAVFFVGLLLLGLYLPKTFNFVGGVIMTPFHYVSNWYQTSEQAIPILLRDRASLEERIKELENEVIIAKGDDLTFRRFQDENMRLRSLLGQPDNQRIAAWVIARPDDLPYDLIQIDQGSSAGIQEFAPVFAGREQLIGLVSSVSRDYSFIKLFTAPGVELTGFISGPDVIATIEGIGGGVARVRVPQGIPLSKDNLVYVPTIEPGLFGQIDFVENRPSQPEQFGYITLQTPLQSLHQVSVSNVPIKQATIELVESGVDTIIAELLLIEEAHTVSFEELFSTSTPKSANPGEE